MVPHRASPAMHLGVLVNPDAGLGGRLGFKGTDGRAREARDAGAEDRAGPRMHECLNHLLSPVRASRLPSLRWSVVAGRMGSTWFPSGIEREVIGTSLEVTSADETKAAVVSLEEAGCDLLLYAGGDGTTRDIVEALQGTSRPELPIVGVPSGVKMHSGCFATTPVAAADVVSAWLLGELEVAPTEVLDLDEDAYLEGAWRVRMYAEAWTPASPRWMQGSKEQVESVDEDEALDALSTDLEEQLMADPRPLVIWGTGGTVHRLMARIGLDGTLLGVDVSLGDDLLRSDVDESDLLELLEHHHGRVLMLLSPMGGQGFLIGRGNLQISPAVLRAAGLDAILGLATPAKLMTIDRLRIDTGDADLDAQFATRRYQKVLQGYRTTRLLRVLTDGQDQD